MIWNDIREWVKGWCARLVAMDVLVSTSADGQTDRLAGHQGAPDDPDSPQPAKRFQHYGWSSRPGAGTEVVQVAAGGGVNNRVTVAERAPGIGPTDHEEWDAEMWHKEGQRIKHDKNGRILIDARQSPAADVVVNGGTKRVSRVDDTVAVGSVFVTTATVMGVLAVTIVYQPPGVAPPEVMLQLNIPGGVAVIPLSGTLEVELRGIINSGAAHFKA